MVEVVDAFPFVEGADVDYTYAGEDHPHSLGADGVDLLVEERGLDQRGREAERGVAVLDSVDHSGLSWHFGRPCAGNKMLWVNSHAQKILYVRLVCSSQRFY